MFYQFDVGCGFARIFIRLFLFGVGIFLGFFHQKQDIAPLSQFHDYQCSPGKIQIQPNETLLRVFTEFPPKGSNPFVCQIIKSRTQKTI